MAISCVTHVPGTGVTGSDGKVKNVSDRHLSNMFLFTGSDYCYTPEKSECYNLFIFLLIFYHYN